MIVSGQSIRAAQLEGFERMLKSVGEAGSPWRVLIYDKFCRDTVTVLAGAKKSLWRDHNVTLKMLIDSQRERVADVAAIYFVQPTQDNLSMIAKDTANGLYDSIHLHFCSPCPKESLEWLAKEVAKQGGAVSIAKVWDQFLGFVSLERTLFSLNFPGSFASYNAANVRDENVIFALSSFAAGLTNALVSFGRVPIIRCERGGPAKELADLVTGRVNALLKDRSMFQAEQTSVESRPMLLILDRGSDMSTPLLHSDVYQCLVDDLLGAIKLNRLEFTADDGKKRLCELDTDVDSFWQKYSGAPIPQAIDAQIEGVKEVDDQARRLGGNPSAALNAAEEGEDNTHLMDAVNALPELTERKRYLALHGSIMSACFAEIKKRGVTKFHEVETRMIQGKQASRNERKNVLDLLADASRDNLDRLRLLLIHAFTAKLSIQEVEELEKVLMGAVDPGKAQEEVRQAMVFARRVLSVATSFTAQPAAASSSSKTAASAFLSTVDSAFSQFQEKLQTVANSVTGSASWGPAARAVDAVCGGGGNNMGANLGAANPLADVSAEIDSQYLYLDPKAGTSPVPPSGARFRGPFQRCFLFVVGGGCYAEYHNLQQYAAQRKREVVYGATEMLSPAEFIKQMRDSA